VQQFGVVPDTGNVNQAGRDIVINTGPAGGTPGLGSVAIPVDEVEHTVRGRSELLARLGDVLAEGSRIVVLHSAGGYGKTTVAVELAKQISERMRVWFVDATSAQSVEEGLREVALRAGAPRELVQAAWLGQGCAPDLLWAALDGLRDPWLLVFDNADDAQVLADQDQRVSSGRGWLRTPKSSGNVVVTSRDGRPLVWGHRALLHPVDALGQDDGAEVLRELAPRAGTGEDARNLTAKLGGLPLALRLAGRYLGYAGRSPKLPGSHQPRSFAEYNAALTMSFTETVTAAPPGVEFRERELLSRTWELSLDVLAKQGQGLARPLLRLLSTLAPAPIPCALLDASVLARSKVCRGITAQQLDSLVADLDGLGLVEHRLDESAGPTTVDTIALHPLVREANRHQADAVDHHDDHTAAQLLMLYNAISGLDYQDRAQWPLWRALLPHVVHASHDQTPSSRHVHGRLLVLSEVQRKAAAYCEEAGMGLQAEYLCRRALDTCTKVLGAEHPTTLTTHHNLAWTFQEQGKFSAAETELRQILAHRERVLGLDHPDTRTTRANLSWMLRERGTLTAIEAQLRDALSIHERTWGREHPSTLSTRDSLIEVLQDRGQPATAEAELREALTIRERVLGAEHSDTLATGDDLAWVLRKRGKA
jgi:hypothetical protein